MSERTGGRLGGCRPPLLVTALVLVSVLGVAVTGPAAALSGDISLTQTITSDQDSFDVSLDLAETQSAFLVVENTATGETHTRTVETNGTVSVDAASVGGLSAGDTLSVTLYRSSALETTIDSASRTVEPSANPGTNTSDSASADAEFDFGTVRVGDIVSEPVRVTSGPSASTSLTFTARITDDDADVFRLDRNEATLDPGESANFSVSYSPTSVGTDTATLILDDGVKETEISVRGTAVRSLLAVEPTSVQFADAGIGETVTRTVTATNRGRSALTVTPRLDSSQFSLVNGSQFTLPGGESRTLSVALTRDTRSSQSAVLSLATNETSSPAAVVSLSSSEIAVNSTVDDSQVTTTARVRNATAGEETTIPVPETPDRDDYELSNVSVTTRTGEDFSVNLTSSSGTLDTTPNVSTGLANNTRRLGNVSVEASISNENISNVSFVYRINRSRLDALETDPADVSLFRFNETTREWVEYDTQVVGAGNGTVTLRTVGDRFSEWTAAAKRPDIRVSDASANVTAVTVGDEVTIQVELTNDGGADGVFLTELLVNGTVVDDRRVTVPDGGTVSVSFARQFDTAATYRVTVNDVSVGTIEVNDATGDAQVSTPDRNQQQGADASDSPGGAGDGETTDSTSNDGGGSSLPLLFGISALVVIVAAGGVLYAGRDDGGESGAEPEDDGNGVIETEGFDEGGDDAE